MSITSSTASSSFVRFGTPAGRWVLVGMVLGSGMVSLDATVVNVALPRLGNSLHTDFAGLQWVLNGYTLTLASLILIGGSLGDRLGRRKVFLIGVVWFAAASLLCGLAPNAATLVGARMLQGVGGALLTPGSLAILQSTFHPDDRAKAIGAWSGLGGVTTAIGPFLGGWLVAAASWRWIFLLNLPLAAVVIWVAVRHVPESRPDGVEGSLDIPGAVLGAIGLAGLTWGLIEQSWPIAAVGAVGLAVFLGAEARRRFPMLPLGIFRSRQFSAANLVTFFVYAGLGSVLFMVGMTLQDSLGYSPVAAGASLFPLTLVMLTFSARAGALAQRIGPRWPMTIGPLGVSGGLLLMTRIEPGRSYASGVLPGVLLFSFGLAATVAPLTATVLAAASDEHSGVASGVNNAVARVGALLAVAAVPIVAGFHAGTAVSPSLLVAGFHRTLVAAAALVSLGALIAWIGIRANVLVHPAGGDATKPADREPSVHAAAGVAPLAVVGTAKNRPPS